MNNTDSEETRRLLAQVGPQNPAVLEQLFERFRPYLRQAISLRLDPRTQSRIDVSDILQEAEIEAARRLETYLGQRPMPFRLWLRRIANDRLVMAHRCHVQADRRTVSRELSLPDATSLALARSLLCKDPSPSEQVSKGELAAKVRRAVADLPETYREVTLMIVFEGLNATEAAQILGIQAATARQRYARALVRMRKLLLEQGIERPADD